MSSNLRSSAITKAIERLRTAWVNGQQSGQYLRLMISEETYRKLYPEMNPRVDDMIVRSAPASGTSG
jgi:hypothetical protein